MQSARRPAVNDPVWYYPKPSDLDVVTFRAVGRPQPCAALVTFVWGDAAVNLRIWDHPGKEHVRHSVQIIGPNEEPPAWEYCMLAPPRMLALPVVSA